MKRNHAFTLIELLIVVAIIAILAAIAVPNFLEAQVRSKVSREKANMRSIATALEAYRTDGNRYPPAAGYYRDVLRDPNYQIIRFLNVLTTPLAYMSSLPSSVFANRSSRNSAQMTTNYVLIDYAYTDEYAKTTSLRNSVYNLLGFYPPETSAIWSLGSWGPDMARGNGYFLVFGEDILNQIPRLEDAEGGYTGPGAVYDPTNGTISNGDIVRVGP